MRRVLAISEKQTNEQTNNAPSFVILPRPSLLSGEVHTGLSEAQLLHVYVLSSHARLSVIFTLDDFWTFSPNRLGLLSLQESPAPTYHFYFGAL